MNRSAKRSTREENEAFTAYAETLEALSSNPKPENDAQPSAFFRHLNNIRLGDATGGGNWSSAPINLTLGGLLSLSEIDHCLAGLSGVLDVLHAAEFARTDDMVENQFGDNLSDRLIYAARALSSSARNTMFALQESWEAKT